MIVVIDYGLGNIRSIFAKYDQMGEKVLISKSINDIENADRLILPGVGAFDAGMNNLHALGLLEILQKRVVQEKIPILGVCLGMQLFTRHSEEGMVDGLGFIEADTVIFSLSQKVDLCVPHMGWNEVSFKQNGSKILENIPDPSRFYFVHSYHLQCDHPEDVVGVTHYGYEYPSIVERDNIIGVQFHPEKSHKQGIQLLRNFLKY